MPLTRPKAAQINFDVTTISDPLLRFNSGQTGSNDKDAGFIYIGNPVVLKQICPGVYGTIKPVGICMIGKK